LELVSIIGLPLFYIIGIDNYTNDCCSESATFSPEHNLTIFTLIIICVISYFISTYTKKIISPIIETLINSILLGGIVLNIFLAIQIEQPIWLFGNLPIVFLFTFELIKNQQKVSEYSLTFEFNTLNKVEKIAWTILNSELILKIPILLIICLPLLTLISGFLLLFGQKPDSFIRAFTDTYKHGFSQLDYMCDNVQCGGHFLCSVAANGHKGIVNPTRFGERGGNKIMCNRQLLVANAFEELIEDKLPKTHKIIRRNYNKVGNLIHHYYGIFNLKIIADIVYVIMKPLEWFFLIILYTFDQNPENRIAKQYLTPTDRNKITDYNKL
tara:strand:- start:99 stop:1076 length:978 start_codon:yes stop_codon:yes gene_type:complete